MDLWIRSQNKKRLMKVEVVEFDKQIDGPAIIYSHEYTLGEYKTKERALEVLDEIQTKIATLNYQKHYQNKDFNLIESNVYEMPED
jgi:hypothetical protein